MIPTYISIDKQIPAGERIIVVDAGGTNFRVATVVFDEKGNARLTISTIIPCLALREKLRLRNFSTRRRNI